MTMERRTLLKTTAGAAVGGPFAGLVAMPAGAHEPPSPGALVPIQDERDGKVRLHLPKGFRYRSFHDTETPVTLNDGTVLPGRHDGMGAFRRAEGHRDPGAQPRGQQPRAGVRPAATPYDPMARGGTTTVQVTPTGQRDRLVHQPERHDDELLRRPDAVGRLGHLRGDRQRPRRGSRLHRRLQRAADEAARLRLRGAGQPHPGSGPVQGEADHARRPVRPRGGLVRPEGRPPLPHRGQLRLPVRLLPLPAAAAPEAGRQAARRRHAADAEGQGRRQRPPRGARRPPARRTTSSGSTSPTPTSSSPTRPASPRRRPTTPRWCTSATRGAPRARPASPGSRARPTTTASSTSPPPRAAVPPRPGRTRSAATATAPDRCGPTTSSGASSPACSSRRADEVLDFPDNVTTSKHGHARGLRGQRRTTTTSAGSPVAGSSSTSRSTGSPARPASARFNDEFAGTTFSPSGQTLFVNIQASRRDDVRDLGAVAQDRRLSGLSPARRPGRRRTGRGRGGPASVRCSRSSR